MIEYLNNFSPVEKGYFYIGLGGLIFFILQSVFTFLDLGDSFDADADMDGDVDSDFSWFGLGLPFNLFTIRGIISFIMLFGFSGVAFSKLDLSFIVVFLLAFLCGFIMMTIVALIYYMAMKLGESGNVTIKDSIGKQCEVYLKIPSNNTGIGKVHIVLNDSLKELDAITLGEEIKSGNLVEVTDIINDKLVVKKIK